MLAYERDVGTLLAQASKYGEATHLAKAAAVIRQDMLQHKSHFSPAVDMACIEQAVPQSLLQFVCMIEHGVEIKSQIHHGTLKSNLAISQLLMFSCFAKSREDTQAVHRHKKDHGTPFAVYIGMSLYAKTRKRKLIDMLHEHGLCISYDRVLEISGQLGDAVLSQYVDEGVVCPPVLRKYLLTTSAVDNIGHNPSATTAKTSFHGTSVSIFQHPAPDHAGDRREPPIINTDNRVKRIPELPETYTSIWPAFLTKNPDPPLAVHQTLPSPKVIQLHLKDEYAWLEQMSLTEYVAVEVGVTWAAYHAQQKRGKPFEVRITLLLPLLRDQAQSLATIKHVMEKVRDTVNFLNQV